MFDEKALRKASWAPGVSVKLGDGQNWEMRRPRIRWYPTRSGGTTKTRAGSADFGPDCDELLGVFFGDVESATWDFPTARFELAIRLLEANYDLTDEHYRELLWYERDDETSTEMWSAIGGVLAGHAPKLTPAI